MWINSSVVDHINHLLCGDIARDWNVDICFCGADHINLHWYIFLSAALNLARSRDLLYLWLCMLSTNNTDAPRLECWPELSRRQRHFFITQTPILQCISLKLTMCEYIHRVRKLIGWLRSMTRVWLPNHRGFIAARPVFSMWTQLHSLQGDRSTVDFCAVELSCFVNVKAVADRSTVDFSSVEISFFYFYSRLLCRWNHVFLLIPITALNTPHNNHTCDMDFCEFRLKDISFEEYPFWFRNTHQIIKVKKGI